MKYKVGIGQDSHRFEGDHAKPLMLAGVHIPFDRGLKGNSDGDVVLHALCHSISSITGKLIIGSYSDKLCSEQGITDSTFYIKEALKTLGELNICHVSVSIECLMPQIEPHIEKMRNRIAELLSIDSEDIGITATSGEGLTAFGQGKGIQAFVITTVMRL
jgi:2-C-methyl-D-erythritol 2,4-cyclodiphosphate synthase